MELQKTPWSIILNMNLRNMENIEKCMPLRKLLTGSLGKERRKKKRGFGFVSLVDHDLGGKIVAEIPYHQWSLRRSQKALLRQEMQEVQHS